MATLIGSGLAGALQVGGTILSTVGAIQAGNAQKAAMNYQAAQLDAAAKTEKASAQRAALEERRQSDLLISRARAVGAASGGGQDLNLLGDIEEDGELRVLTAQWEGDEAAKGRRQQAASARFEGEASGRAGKMKALTGAVSGASSFYDKYS